MAFKHPKDEAFFKALRAAKLPRKLAFRATIKSRKARDKPHTLRFGEGFLWTDAGINMVVGQGAFSNLLDEHYKIVDTAGDAPAVLTLGD